LGCLELGYQYAEVDTGRSESSYHAQR
jgi:hypothetical protein